MASVAIAIGSITHTHTNTYKKCECPLCALQHSLNMKNGMKTNLAFNSFCSLLYCQIYCEFIAFISSYCVSLAFSAKERQKQKRNRHTVETFKVTKNDGNKIALPFPHQCNTKTNSQQSYLQTKILLKTGDENCTKKHTLAQQNK